MHSGGFATSTKGTAARAGSFAGRVFRHFSRIIAVNEELADVFRRFGAGRIVSIPPFALTHPNADVTVPGELAAFYKSHSPLLISVGGLEKEYDPLTQIAAVKEIQAELPDAGLLIVGGGSMQVEVEAAIKASGFRTKRMMRVRSATHNQV